MSEIKIEKRYRALRFISKVYMLLAWLSAIGGVIAMLIAKGYEASAAFFAGTFAFVTLLAISEGIQIFIDIEENTRVAAAAALNTNSEQKDEQEK